AGRHDRALDRAAGRDEIAETSRRHLEADARGIDERVERAAEGQVVSDRAETRHLDPIVQRDDERRDVLERDAPHARALALRPGGHASGWRIQPNHVTPAQEPDLQGDRHERDHAVATQRAAARFWRGQKRRARPRPTIRFFGRYPLFGVVRASPVRTTLSVMSDDLRLRAIGAPGDSDPVVSIEPAEAEMHDVHRSDLDALKDGATMLTQAGNRVAALAVMLSAVAIAPTDLGAHQRLAAMLQHAGDIAGPANEYARYIEFM